MSVTILLDSGPLGLVSNPNASHQNDLCKEWLNGLLNQGIKVILSEIADYEVRRELIRAEKIQGIKRLDDFRNTLTYLPITTAVMRQAAQFWAEARQQGYPTAHEHALDGDVILAAQAAILREQGHDIVVATTNVKHLERFVPAKVWQDISLPDTPQTDAN